MAPQPFLASLAQSGEYSDFTLVCKDHEFKLHQVIVCPQPSVIKATVTGGFQETTSKTLIVNEFDISTVQHMIQYLYTEYYQIYSESGHTSSDNEQNDDRHGDDGHGDDTNHDDTDHASQSSFPIPELDYKEIADEMASHLRVNAIADYYNIPNLVQLAASRFRNILERNQHAVLFPPILQEISTTNRDPELRSMIASAVIPRVHQLSKLKAFQDIELEHDVVVEIFRACGEKMQLLYSRLYQAEQNVRTYQRLLSEE
ncbi:hypothetical protein FSST1_006399 [Fusarium sambucinum]